MQNRRLVLAYWYAVLAAFLAGSARLLLDRLFGYHHPYATFYVGVLLSAWYGGIWPALITITLSALAVTFLGSVPSLLAAQPGGPMGLEFFFVVSLTAAVLFEAQRRSQQALSATAEIARHRLAQLEAETAIRQKAEVAVRQAHEQFRVAFEHAPVGICQFQSDGTIAEVNPEFCRILGRFRTELIGQDFAAIIYPKEFVPGLHRLTELLQGHLPYYTEQLETHRDGIPVWLTLSVAAVSASEGDVACAIGAVEDITARLQSEERLRETQKLESVALLAGGVAHDFNNLLTGVLGNASLAIETVPPESPVRRMLDGVVQAAERAANLTSQLLAYAGKSAAVVRNVDLSQAVQAAGELVQMSIPDTVPVLFELRRDLPRLLADSGQIQQIVSSLLLNAAEAIAESPRTGGIRVATDLVRFGPREKLPQTAVGDLAGGEYLVLRVQDTGSGMESSVMRQMFDPFFTTKFMGRGLGLAAVAGIVRTKGGAVLVSSLPNIGTTISVLLPVQSNSKTESTQAADNQNAA